MLIKRIDDLLTPELMQSYERLSHANIEFFEHLSGKPKALVHGSYQNIVILSTKDVKLQPWPIFISRRCKEDFRLILDCIFKLIKRIPERVFNNDAVKLEEYYGIPKQDLQYQLQSIETVLPHLVGRADFIISNNGIKILEYNITANLGGWETIHRSKACLGNAIISEFIQNKGLPVMENDIIRLLFYHVYVNIQQSNPNVKNLNIFMGDYEYQNKLVQFKAAEVYFNQLYGQYLKERGEGSNGRVLMGDYSKMRTISGALFHENTPIHAVIELNHGKVPNNIVHLARSKKLVLLNGPITSFMTNKLNLAVLSENCESSVFTQEEQEVIRRNIPWTRKLRPIETEYRGTRGVLRDIVLENRIAMVIKRADGYGGTGVFMGEQQTEKEWRDLVERAIHENGWLVQEYVESRPFLFLHGDEGCVEHDVIWGGFMYDSMYVGTFIRVLPKRVSHAVINSHQGAESGVVIELDEQHQ